jgi:hypothetical protein
MKFKNLIYHIGLLVFIVFILAIFFHDTAVALTDVQKASLVSFGSDLQSNNGITEADPVFTSSPANNISSSSISNWNAAYGWGNHATAGYIKSYTETDPIFIASPANGITANNITAWNNTNSIVAGNATTWTNKQAALGYTAANAALQINGHALSGNFNLAATDVSAVSNSIQINGHALTANANVTLADVGGVSNAIQVNGHALTANANVTLADLGISAVQNTAISTWVGSANVTTLGTITSGIWQGTAIANSYIANAASWLTSAFTGTANIVSLGTITSGTWNANAITDSYVANSSKWNNSYNAWNTNGTNWNSTYADWNANKANWDNFSSANKVTFTTTGATTLTYSLTSGNAPLCNTAISANNVVCWKATGSLGHCNGNNTGNGTCNCI